jgi:hypothetical protein
MADFVLFICLFKAMFKSFSQFEMLVLTLSSLSLFIVVHRGRCRHLIIHFRIHHLSIDHSIKYLTHACFYLFQISEKYYREKGHSESEVIEHKVVSQKWSRLLGEARKKRTTARKAAVGTGGGPEGPTLDALSQLILSAAEENADLVSNTDCEPGFISQGEDDDEDELAVVAQEQEHEENPQPSTSDGRRPLLLGGQRPLLLAQNDSFSHVNASIHGNQLLVGSQESLAHLSFGNGDPISLFSLSPSQQSPEELLEEAYFPLNAPDSSPVHVTPPPSPTAAGSTTGPPQIPQLSAAISAWHPPSLVAPVLALTRGQRLAAAVNATMPRATVSSPPRSASPAVVPAAVSNRRQGITAALDAALPRAATAGATAAASAGGGPVRRQRARRAQSAILGQYYENRAETEGTMLERISGARREAADKEKAFNELLLSAKREEVAEAKAIRDIEKEKAAVDLEAAKVNKAKLEAENFTAQLRKSMTIAQYNQLLGTNVAIPELPDF